MCIECLCLTSLWLLQWGVDHFSMDPKVLVADGEELTELYEDSKITHLTIATVWYVGVIMRGYFGEDRSISYQSDKAHFGLFWAIAHTLLCCLENDSIPSIPGFNKNDLPLAKQTALDHLEGVGADLGSVERKVFPGLASGGDGNEEEAEDEDEGDF